MKRIKLAAALAAVGLLMLVPGSARANNLVVTNASLRWLTASTAKVAFDIAWDNSWRYTNVNHDAAWVFFKVQKEGDVSNNWQHVTLEGTGTNPPGYSTGTGTGIELIVPDDRVGLFVRRTAEGSGPVAVQNVQVLWNFASNGLAKTANVRLQVLAVEMVYVAQGRFYVGSGGTETASLTEGNSNTTWISMTTPSVPLLITNEAALAISNEVGCLWGTSTTPAWEQIGPPGVLQTAFPKGYAAFYCMKYEMTQGQYRDFLNSLTRDQQVTRTASQVASNFAMSATADISWRSGIRYPGVIPAAPTSIVFGCDANTNMVFNEANDGMDCACGYVSGNDGLAFYDWAGLRPMTELEFEKACRGPNAPVANEKAWGNADVQYYHMGITNSGMGTEKVDVAGGYYGNCNFGEAWYYWGPCPGPIRVGIFATASSDRVAAGASYWGIMELSGNVWEVPVTVGNDQGRAFTGLCGDGKLNSSGAADVTGWPDYTGLGSRGSWGVSSRPLGSMMNSGAGRQNDYGARGVRQAPSGVGP